MTGRRSSSAGQGRPAPVDPELKRLQNMAAWWAERYAKASDDHAAMAAVSFDRAKAAAFRAEADGRGPALYDLAQMLSAWAERIEKAEQEQLQQRLQHQMRRHAS